MTPFLCKTCGETDPANFPIEVGKHLHSRCRACRTRLRARRTPEERRRQLLASKWQMTPEQYDSQLARQGNRCATCRLPHEERIDSRSWPVDHDHLTGRIRGILCGSCNRALGYVDDNVNTLSRMVTYLHLYGSSLARKELT